MEYELVHEIQNLCRNNQMRDVFFEEVECDDPEEYLRWLKRCRHHPRRGGWPDGKVRLHPNLTKPSLGGRWLARPPQVRDG